MKVDDTLAEIGGKTIFQLFDKVDEKGIPVGEPARYISIRWCDFPRQGDTDPKTYIDRTKAEYDAQ